MRRMEISEKRRAIRAKTKGEKQTGEKPMRDPTLCQRCLDKNQPAAFQVTSEIIKLNVCSKCALEAMDLLGPKPGDLKIGKLPAQSDAPISA